MTSKRRAGASAANRSPARARCASSTPCATALRRATASAAGEMSRPVTHTSGRDFASATAMHPLPVPTSQMVAADALRHARANGERLPPFALSCRRARESADDLHERSVSGRGIEHVRRDGERQRPELLHAGDVGDRLAAARGARAPVAKRASAASAQRRRAGARRAPRDRSPARAASSTSASRRARLDAGGRQARGRGRAAASASTAVGRRRFIRSPPAAARPGSG